MRCYFQILIILHELFFLLFSYALGIFLLSTIQNKLQSIIKKTKDNKMKLIF